MAAAHAMLRRAYSNGGRRLRRKRAQSVAGTAGTEAPRAARSPIEPSPRRAAPRTHGPSVLHATRCPRCDARAARVRGGAIEERWEGAQSGKRARVTPTPHRAQPPLFPSGGRDDAPAARSCARARRRSSASCARSRRSRPARRARRRHGGKPLGRLGLRRDALLPQLLARAERFDARAMPAGARRWGDPAPSRSSAITTTPAARDRDRRAEDRPIRRRGDRPPPRLVDLAPPLRQPAARRRRRGAARRHRRHVTHRRLRPPLARSPHDLVFEGLGAGDARAAGRRGGGALATAPSPVGARGADARVVRPPRLGPARETPRALGHEVADEAAAGEPTSTRRHACARWEAAEMGDPDGVPPRSSPPRGVTMGVLPAAESARTPRAADLRAADARERARPPQRAAAAAAAGVCARCRSIGCTTTGTSDDLVQRSVAKLRHAKINHLMKSSFGRERTNAAGACANVTTTIPLIFAIDRPNGFSARLFLETTWFNIKFRRHQPTRRRRNSIRCMDVSSQSK